MKKLIIIFIILFWASGAWGANWYVDMDGANGDGSQGTPWNELENVTGTSPGDSIYARGTLVDTSSEQKIRRCTGTYWYGNDPTWAGSNQATVIMPGDNYGIVFESGENSNIVIDGFYVSNPIADGKSALYVGSYNSEIRNCIIKDAGASAFSVRAYKSDITKTYIHNNDINGVGLTDSESGYGINLTPNPTTYNYLGGFTVTYNTWRNLSESPIGTMGSYVLVANNYVWGVGELSPSGNENCWQHNARSGVKDTNLIFINNVCANITGSGATPSIGAGEWISNIFVQNNIFANATGINTVANFATGHLGYRSDQFVFKNNIVYNFGTADCVNETNIFGGAIRIYSFKPSGINMVTGTYIKDNIFFNDKYPDDNIICVTDPYANYDVAGMETWVNDTKGGTASGNKQIKPAIGSVFTDEVTNFMLATENAAGAKSSNITGGNTYAATVQIGTDGDGDPCVLFPDDYNGDTRPTGADPWNMGPFSTYNEGRRRRTQ
ncbi:MAG: hypothetical protein GY853_13455 [PVC group bacterium]|nr:hypothetical protein [PVC group bacterium]